MEASHPDIPRTTMQVHDYLIPLRVLQRGEMHSEKLVIYILSLNWPNNGVPYQKLFPYSHDTLSWSIAEL